MGTFHPEFVWEPKGRALDAFDTVIEWLASRTDELGVPGAAVGVVTSDQRFTRGIGVANADTGEAFTPSTPFGIASLTKIFTATALASLAHNGALGLDDSVRQHLPDFRIADPEATGAVTIGHLLSHAGGWADVLEPVPGQDSLAWYAAQMGDVPQVVPVGTRFSYSNSGFLLAGAVTEQVVGVSYENTIAESVLQPLGMTDTGFANGPDAASNRAVGHQIVDGERAVIPLADIPRAVNPAAGLISTVDDMLTFVQAHAAIDPGRLDPEALASMRQPRISGGSLGPVVVDRIGTCWMLLDIGGETVLMSQGGDAGLISAMVAVPARQFGMVVFANSESAMTLVNDAVLRGLTDFVGLSLPEPEAYALARDEAANAEGRYGLPEWLSFTVTPANGSLDVATTASGQELPNLSGRFTMTSATQGFMPYLGGRLWLDLVQDDTGAIHWLRFAARLVPRAG
jgi:CubicO group peptidase (beta-lactamase class C family)